MRSLFWVILVLIFGCATVVGAESGPQEKKKSFKERLYDRMVNTRIERQYDYNGDGTMQPTESSAMWRNIPRKVSQPEQVPYDRNRDGRLNKKEATKMLEEKGDENFIK